MQRGAILAQFIKLIIVSAHVLVLLSFLFSGRGKDIDLKFGKIEHFLCYPMHYIMEGKVYHGVVQLALKFYEDL